MNVTDFKEIKGANNAPHYSFTNDCKISSSNVIPEDEFRSRTREVFNYVSSVLTRTLGPYGSTTIIEQYGEMHITKDGFMVLKGSVVADGTTPSLSENLKKFRNKLFEKGIIGQDFVFQNDYVFTSPSLAAVVVMGRNANGRTEWKTIDRQSIKDIEEN